MNRQYAAVLRREFPAFVMKVYRELHPGTPTLELAWYLDAICHALVQAAVVPGSRLVINVPPRHLKSIAAAVALPAWLLGRDPTVKIMIATYNDDLAKMHARDFRKILRSSWYKALFPALEVMVDTSSGTEIVTGAGGFRRGVSVGGGVTGHGADIIIMDDCAKAEDVRSPARRDELKAWFDGSLATRLNALGQGAIISIAQRLHEDDLPAYLLEKGYDHLCLPAIAERDEDVPVGKGVFHHRTVGSLLGRSDQSIDILELERRRLGRVVFSAMYQQNPVLPGGNIIRPEWFPRYEEEFERADFRQVVQSWDTGLSEEPTADYSVCTTWGWRERHWYLIDVFRERLAFPDLRRAVLRLKRQWRPDRILIEDAGSGISLWQEFRASGDFRPVMCRPVDGKEERAVGVTGQLEAGLCLLPADAPWLDAFLSEVRAFPLHRHDDQVDSMTQFLEHYLRHAQDLLATRDPVTGRKLFINRRQSICRR